MKSVAETMSPAPVESKEKPSVDSASAEKRGDSTENNEDGDAVEVVLGNESNPTIVDASPTRPKREEGVFRAPAAVRPSGASMRGAPPPPPPSGHYGVPSSGSWGYGAPPPDYRGRPYPVPSYSQSAPSFDDPGYAAHHATPHYSPAVSYPGYRTSEDVNVISPNHKGDPHYHHPHTPRSNRNMPPPNYYHYPPASPVSRHDTPGSSRGRAHPPVRRDGSYSRPSRGTEYPEDGTWNRYPRSHSPGRPHPSVVAESSFDSEAHVSRESQSHATPRSTHHAPPAHHPSDPHYQLYGGAASFGSFDSAAGGGPPPHFDDHRYYGYPPESPYTPYHAHSYSAPDIYRADSYPHPGVHPAYSGHHHPASYPYHYDDEERSKSKKDSKSSSNNSSSNSMLLPKAAEEVDFEVTDPPLEPVLEPSDKAVCESLAEVNGYDVLCGRGGGTNSQVGNRRFRKLVQEFQPTYLLARRKEKPLLARTIVLIIRKRGGRFLKKDEETGELFEVGDSKAEAKTSQALREGLDVRATKNAASSLLEKKKKKQLEEKKEAEAQAAADRAAKVSPAGNSKSLNADEKKSPAARDTSRDSPPTLPRLQEDSKGTVRMHSPEEYAERKRRRARAIQGGDRFFPDFCPPRAEMRGQSPSMADEDDGVALTATPMRREDPEIYEDPRGCAGIAFDVMTGAATGSFCLGPSGWRG